MAGLLEGKKYLVMGVANKRSIAWAIAQALHREGALLAFTYQGERLGENVRELTQEAMPDSPVLPCDVTVDEEIAQVAEQLRERFGRLDGLVHSLAFANSEDLEGAYVNTSRKGFLLALEISAFSLTAVARYFAPLMSEGGSIVTMTYLGGERVVPNYNVMGVAKAALDASVKYLANDLGPQRIRVNAISAGPIRTLAAKGIRNFNSSLHTFAEKAPLRRPTEAAEVGDTALFLMSDLSRGITGEILHVDSGFHILGGMQ